MKITHIRATGAVAAIIIGFCTVVYADDLEDAAAATQQGDYAEAIRLLTPLAEQGNSSASNSLGALYYKGQGVDQDFTVATEWYKKAAERGSVTAQTTVGLMYFMGTHVAKDYVEAHKWLGLAAQAGSANAEGMFNLVSNRLTPEQVADSNRIISEWQPVSE
jgi:hypothetical protein